MPRSERPPVRRDLARARRAAIISIAIAIAAPGAIAEAQVIRRRVPMSRAAERTEPTRSQGLSRLQTWRKDIARRWNRNRIRRTVPHVDGSPQFRRSDLLRIAAEVGKDPRVSAVYLIGSRNPKNGLRGPRSFSDYDLVVATRERASEERGKIHDRTVSRLQDLGYHAPLHPQAGASPMGALSILVADLDQVQGRRTPDGHDAVVEATLAYGDLLWSRTESR